MVLVAALETRALEHFLLLLLAHALAALLMSDPMRRGAYRSVRTPQSTPFRQQVPQTCHHDPPARTVAQIGRPRNEPGHHTARPRNPAQIGLPQQRARHPKPLSQQVRKRVTHDP